MSRRAAAVLLLLVLAGCFGEKANTAKKPEAEKKPFRPPILLVTLDTTRADALTPEVAPNFTKLARRGIYFEQAYSTAPSTLTAHASMMSGLYPAGHGIHENGRFLESGVPLVAEELKELGYTTLAFVSGYPLDGHFGLSRGFGLYDDDFGTDEKGAARVERPAAATIAQVVPYIGTAARLDMPPYFVWVHFYDPHEPYAPPEPFRGKFPGDPYLGEIAAMDDALGKLVGYFERATFPKGRKILVLADHGEGRGEHGEMLHGNLLYQGVMQVPMAIAGDGVEEARRTDPVSTRQVRATLLSWARGKTEEGSLLEPSTAPVLGEAMQPFLNFRWQPQVMAVGGNIKLIRSGRFEIYDVLADPAEKNDLALAGNEPERALAKAIADYPLPTAKPGADVKDLGIEERQKLASLGYIASESTPTRVPENAPRAADMTPLFAELDAASHEFVGGAYQQAAARFEKILAADPGNLMAAVRMAVSLSLIGRDAQAMEAFARAKKIDPESLEVSHYLAMHHMKNRRPEQAAPLFEKVLAAQPNRHAALAGLAEIALGKGQLERAAELFQKSLPSAPEPGPVRIELARLRMELGQTEAAIEAFEAARNDYGKERFRYDLELGVLYLAERNFEAARDALDRVPADHPAYALALFKRAQVSVLLAEPDRAEKVKAALAKADPESRRLIQNEKLFAGLLPR
jgi:choline-sulfatase